MFIYILYKYDMHLPCLMMRWFIVQLIHIQYIFASTESLPRGTRGALIGMHVATEIFSNLD